ncbi:MAG: hypothetical protein HIU82_04460 [Proteobacteria bacterium]|nr:hypothetical protein [Pseudomonadota bacterium]
MTDRPMTDHDGDAPTALATRQAAVTEAEPRAVGADDVERRRPGRVAYTNPALLALLRQQPLPAPPEDAADWEPTNPLGPMRGIALAAAIGVALWAAALLALWVIWPG